MVLQHKNGGKIESITAIEHSTYKGVAEWELRGRVIWDDGSVSESAHIAPWQVCCDNSVDEQMAEWRRVSEALSAYLDEQGTWHEAKEKRDGRIYHWTPHKPSGSKPL